MQHSIECFFAIILDVLTTIFEEQATCGSVVLVVIRKPFAWSTVKRVNVRFLSGEAPFCFRVVYRPRQRFPCWNTCGIEMGHEPRAV